MVNDAELVAAHMQMLLSLVARSTAWQVPRLWHGVYTSRGQQPLMHRQQQDGAVTWPLTYSTNCSGRLLLRLEYLLATGQDKQVGASVITVLSLVVPGS